MCNIVLDYAIDYINSAVRRLRYRYRQKGYSSTKGLENDYAMGFINGMRAKFEEQKRANQEWGLVLVKDREVVEAYDQIDFKGTVNTRTNYKGHSEAFEKGYADGGKFSISDKITEGENEAPLGLDCGT